MRPINDAMKGLTNKPDFKQRFEAMKAEILSNREIKEFIKNNEEVVNDEMINRSLVHLFEYINQSKECNKCASLNECKNMLQGYHPHLVIQGRSISLNYERCPKKVLHDERKKHSSLIQSIYVPKDILRASMSDLDLDNPSRLQAVKLAHEFVQNYTGNEKSKGLYLYGPFGVGKTFILGAIANELAEHSIASMLIYVPEFMRELKSSFQDQSLNEKLEAVKKVPVLMLDDIGAESMSSWMRDDILGAILQFRMLEDLPTFFTSNFDLAQLEHHLAYTQRGEEEKVKAARIMERIKFLSKPIELRGANRRMT
ncbi:primosomal protein DnaI [Bacillus timonensis]|nr:primosomal protein DnaI [Bacillus timonensis]